MEVHTILLSPSTVQFLTEHEVRSTTTVVLLPPWCTRTHAPYPVFGSNHSANHRSVRRHRREARYSYSVLYSICESPPIVHSPRPSGLFYRGEECGFQKGNGASLNYAVECNERTVLESPTIVLGKRDATSQKSKGHSEYNQC
jgi:hypothetical protein